MVRSISERSIAIIAVDAVATAGHESVQVGTTDQGEPGAEGDARDDVGPGHDPGVNVDLGVLADLAYHHGQQVEGYRAPYRVGVRRGWTA